ncbi:MAG TPA: glycosyltransferase family 2 protein [Bacteroidales bacterium]|nr:glycosyltransferase family 2 protein [Bacteroidales bacterium]
MKVSVVILNWNGKSLMQEYLPNVVKHTLGPEGVELVVADNGSQDGSLEFLAEVYPSIRRIELGHNHGFAEGYNMALAQVDAEYVVLLNSDVEVTANWLPVLIDYMDQNPEVAACQPKIRSLREPEYFEHAGAAGGYMDFLGYPFCRGRLLSVVEKDFGQYDQPADIFWATGACLCIRTEDYRSAGGLDARFFAHMEEIDLCWRLRSRGKRIVCLPACTVFHLGGATLSKENPHKTFLNFRNNLLMLYKNTSERRFCTVFIFRLMLDYLSGLVFLLTGKPHDAWAVVRARFAFWSMRPLFNLQRMENKKQATVDSIPEVFRGSILWNYYFGGKRNFRDLNWK